MIYLLVIHVLQVPVVLLNICRLMGKQRVYYMFLIMYMSQVRGSEEDVAQYLKVYGKWVSRDI